MLKLFCDQCDCKIQEDWIFTDHNGPAIRALYPLGFGPGESLAPGAPKVKYVGVKFPERKAGDETYALCPRCAVDALKVLVAILEAECERSWEKANAPLLAMRSNAPAPVI